MREGHSLDLAAAVMCRFDGQTSAGPFINPHPQDTIQRIAQTTIAPDTRKGLPATT
jgi:hypothetical protein